jgi:hypothetical protein
VVGLWYDCFTIIHGEYWATKEMVNMVPTILTLDCWPPCQAALKTKKETKGEDED